MLLLDNATLYRGHKLLFEQASLQVYRGQRVGVVGVNGSGKSSLFSLVQGELETDHGLVQLQSGLSLAHVAQQSPDTDAPALEFVLDGDRELRDLQAQLADLESASPTGKQADRLHRLHERMEHIDAYGAEARAARLLSGLGFADSEHRQSVGTFSGGWRMRLALAQALMCRSDLLLLDEPTNHLDLPAILWLERWLRSFDGLLMLVSHDRDFLDAVCTHVIHIENQSLTLYAGNYSAFEKLRAEQLSHQQAMFQRQQKEIAHIQKYVDRFRYKASKARQAQSRLKMLERMSLIAPAHVDSPFHFSFLEPDRQPQHLLSLEDASAGYGKQPVISGIKISIQAGSRIGLLGVNGAGKSTLLKALVDGSTLLEGTRTVHPHTRMAYFAQHQMELLEPKESPLWHVRQEAPDAAEQDLRNHLGMLGFGGDRCEEPVAPFSGGEKARLVLAMIILRKPNLLLLDEPTNHLDLEMRHALSMALVEYSGALLVISHDRHLLRSVCDELWLVHDGQVLEFPHELDAYPEWLRQLASGSGDADAPGASSSNRKARRQASADQRQKLAPLRKRIRALEASMGDLRNELEQVEQHLADEALYTDPERKAELSALVERQGQARKELDELETGWLECSELYEQAAAE